MSIQVRTHTPHPDGWLYQPQDGEQWDNDPARTDYALRYSEEYQQKYFIFWLQARAAEWAKTVGDDKIRYIDTCFRESTPQTESSTAAYRSEATISMRAYLNFACLPPKDWETGTSDPLRTVPIIKEQPVRLTANYYGVNYLNMYKSALIPNDFNSGLDAWSFRPWSDNPTLHFPMDQGGNLNGEAASGYVNTWFHTGGTTSSSAKTVLFQPGFSNRSLQLYCVQGTEAGNEFFFYTLNSEGNNRLSCYYYIGRTHDIAPWLYDAPELGGGWVVITNHQLSYETTINTVPVINYPDRNIFYYGNPGSYMLPSDEMLRLNWNMRNSYHAGNRFQQRNSMTGPWYKNMYFYNHTLDPLFHLGDNMLFSGMSETTYLTGGSKGVLPRPGYTQMKVDGKLYLNVAERAFVRIK